MYFDAEANEEDVEAIRGSQQVKWFKEQLSNTSDRKFILISHVYAGSRYWA